MKRIVELILHDPLKVFDFLRSKLLILFMRLSSKVIIAGSIRVSGVPIIDLRSGTSLILEDGVVLNSRNKGYHLNMFAPVKLFADKPGAVISIGKNTRIHGSAIHAFESIEIGKNCLIAANCQIFDGNGHATSFDDVENRINTKGGSRPVCIKDNVWLGVNVVVLPGVTIGEGSIVSANSVVTKDIPAMSVVRGNPATVVKVVN